MSKKCTPLCGVKHIAKSNVWRFRSTFGSCDVEKVHAVVWREAHFETVSEHFWKLRCRKSARHFVAWSTFRSQMSEGFGALLEVEMLKKCTLLWCKAHFQVKTLKPPHAQTTFEGSDVALRCRRKGFCTLPKVSKTGWFCSFSKNDVSGTFEEDLQRCMWCGKRSARDMFIRDVRRSGRWFPERGCILEHQIFRFAKMILRDRCSTSYDLRSTLDRWSGKTAKRIGMRPSALHSSFHVWRKSRRIASFLMLSTSKHEQVSQNCSVFDVVKFKNWGSLAE